MGLRLPEVRCRQKWFAGVDSLHMHWPLLTKMWHYLVPASATDGTNITWRIIRVLWGESWKKIAKTMKNGWGEWNGPSKDDNKWEDGGDVVVVRKYRSPPPLITCRHALRSETTMIYRTKLSHNSVTTWSRKQVTNYLAQDVETSNL